MSSYDASIQSVSSEIFSNFVFFDDVGRKGVNGGRLEWQRQLEEEDNIIFRWAQENVETLYSLQNK